MPERTIRRDSYPSLFTIIHDVTEMKIIDEMKDVKLKQLLEVQDDQVQGNYSKNTLHTT